MKNDKKLDFKVLEYFENKVIFRIVKQDYRNDLFYQDISGFTHRFKSSNGFVLSSVFMPDYDENFCGTCFVRGTKKNLDNSKIVMPIKDFKLFHEAVKEYNEQR